MARYFNTYDSKVYPNDADHQGLGTAADNTALETYVGAKTGLSFGSEEDNRNLVIDGTVTIGSGDTSFPSTGVLVVKDKYISFTNDGKLLVGSSSTDDAHVYFLNCVFDINDDTGFSDNSQDAAMRPNVSRSQVYTDDATERPSLHFINCTMNHNTVSNGQDNSSNWQNYWFNDFTHSTMNQNVPYPQRNLSYLMDKGFLDNAAFNFNITENDVENTAFEPSGEISSAADMNIQSTKLYNFSGGQVIFENVSSSGNNDSRDLPGFIGVSTIGGVSANNGENVSVLTSPFDDIRADDFWYWRTNTGNSYVTDTNDQALAKGLICVEVDLKFYGNEERTVGREGLSVAYNSDFLSFRNADNEIVIGDFATNPSGAQQRGTWTTSNSGSDTSVSYLQISNYDILTGDTQSTDTTLFTGSDVSDKLFIPSFYCSYDVDSTETGQFRNDTTFVNLDPSIEIFSFLGTTYRNISFRYDDGNQLIKDISSVTFSATSDDHLVFTDADLASQLFHNQRVNLLYDGTSLDVTIRAAVPGAFTNYIVIQDNSNLVDDLNDATSVTINTIGDNVNYDPNRERAVRLLQEEIIDGDDMFLDKYTGDTVATKTATIKGLFTSNATITLNDIYAILKTACSEYDPGQVPPGLPPSLDPYSLIDEDTRVLDLTSIVYDDISLSGGSDPYSVVNIVAGLENFQVRAGHIGPNGSGDLITKLKAYDVDLNHGRLEADIEVDNLLINPYSSTSRLQGTYSIRNCTVDGTIQVGLSGSADRYIRLENLSTSGLTINKSGGTGQLIVDLIDTPTSNITFGTDVVQNIISTVTITHPDTDVSLSSSDFTHKFIQSDGTDVTGNVSVSVSDNVATFSSSHGFGTTVGYAIHYVDSTNSASYITISNQGVDTSQSHTLQAYTIDQIPHSSDGALAASLFTVDNGTDGEAFESDDTTLRVRVNSNSTTNLTEAATRYTLQNSLGVNEDWLIAIATANIPAEPFLYTADAILLDDDLETKLTIERQTAVTTPAWFWNSVILDQDENDLWNMLTSSTDAGKVIYFRPNTVGVSITQIGAELDARLLTKNTVGNLGLGLPAKDEDDNLYTTPSV